MGTGGTWQLQVILPEEVCTLKLLCCRRTIALSSPSQQNSTALPPIAQRTNKCSFAHSILLCTGIKNWLKLLDCEQLQDKSILLAIKQHVEHCWKSLHPTVSLSEKLLYWFPTLRLPIIFPVKASFSVTFYKGNPQDFFQWTIEQVLCTFSFLSLSIGADSSNGLTCCHSDVTGCVQSLCVGTEVSFSSKGTWGSSITWILLCYYNCTDDSLWTVTKSSKTVNRNNKS